jgi:hypothetical protein
LSGIRRKVDDPGLRDRFLNIIARHKAVVLCAHLHRYSVVSRETLSGPVVQVMVNSVNREFNVPPPDTIITSYEGGKFVDDNLSFQPATENMRRQILDYEKQYVKYFMNADLPGYAVIKVFGDRNEILLSYYSGFSKTPCYNINLSDLQK